MVELVATVAMVFLVVVVEHLIQVAVLGQTLVATVETV
jgi:hypothetical protein